MSEFNVIVATSLNGVIGDRSTNSMPWHLPSDLKEFKRLTTGGCVIMGRKTLESMGNQHLPNRANYIVSSEQFRSVQSALETAWYIHPEKEVFVIGGEGVYREALSLSPKNIYITVVEKELAVTDTTALFPIPGQRFKGEFIMTDFGVYNSVARTRIIEENDFSYQMYHFKRG